MNTLVTLNHCDTLMVVDESVRLLKIMGNWTSCCSYTSPLSRRKDVNGAVNEFTPEGEESVGNLQHISEREHDDWNTDPSVHPKVATIFLERSKVESMINSILIKYLLLYTYLAVIGLPTC